MNFKKVSTAFFSDFVIKFTIILIIHNFIFHLYESHVLEIRTVYRHYIQNILVHLLLDYVMKYTESFLLCHTYQTNID